MYYDIAFHIDKAGLINNALKYYEIAKNYFTNNYQYDKILNCLNSILKKNKKILKEIKKISYFEDFSKKIDEILDNKTE